MDESSGSAPASHEALAVVLQVRDGRLQVLLWQRAREPFNGAWALPGGLLGPSETLEASIRRHLAAKVDVRELAHLEQLETRSDPARHPGRMIATAYLGLVPTHHDPAVPADTPWHPVNAPRELAFDHGVIVLAGRERARARRVRHQPAAGPAAPGGAGTDGRVTRSRTVRRPPGGAVPVPEPAPGDHRPVRRAPPPGLTGSHSHPQPTGAAATRGVPEVGRGRHQQVPLDGGLGSVVACSPSLAGGRCGLVVRL